MVLADIALIAYSAAEIQADGINGNVARLLAGWFIHAIIGRFGAVFWCLVADVDNKCGRQDEKKDGDIATTSGQPSATKYPIV